MKLVFLAASWLLVCGAGWAAMESYGSSSTLAGKPPENWPTSSQLHPGGTTLLMFAHPHCPCTRASIGELAKLMARAQGKVRTYVLFWQPEKAGAAWSRTDLWRSAAEIPGVEARADVDGVEAHRFNIAASGQTVLYVDGRLRFAGGITGSRGHAGDNAGEDAVLALLQTGRGAFAATPAYGCLLTAPRP